MKTKYFMTKQVVWAFRDFFLQFDTNFASEQQRLAKIGIIFFIVDVVLDFASLTYHATGRKCGVWHAWLWTTTEDIGVQYVWPYTAARTILTITCIEDK